MKVSVLRIFVIFFLPFVPALVSAQGDGFVSGEIVSAENNGAIPYATVFLKETRYGASTDTSGLYGLQSAGRRLFAGGERHRLRTHRKTGPPHSRESDENFPRSHTENDRNGRSGRAGQRRGAREQIVVQRRSHRHAGAAKLDQKPERGARRRTRSQTARIGWRGVGHATAYGRLQRQTHQNFHRRDPAGRRRKFIRAEQYSG